MTALAKLRSQVEHARQQGTMVVLTPDEAQAVLDEHRRALNAEIRAGEREDLPPGLHFDPRFGTYHYRATRGAGRQFVALGKISRAEGKQ